MGLKYRINCYRHHVWTLWTEFSVSSSIHVKTVPDDERIILEDWIPFLFEHGSCKSLGVIDEYGNETRPDWIDGAYVLFGHKA